MKSEHKISPGLIIVSLLGTPWLIFAATAVHLYIKNQEDLYYRMEVVIPFLVIVPVITAIGYILFQRSHDRSSKYLLWIYYLLGPFFLVFNEVRNSAVGHVAAMGILSITLVVFYMVARQLDRKAKLLRVAEFFALMSLTFVGTSVYELYHKHKVAPGSAEFPAVASMNEDQLAPGKRYPNVYHIVLDEFQTEMFLLTLTPEVRNSLGGFVFFPETTSIFGRTGMSLPSIFTGKDFDTGTRQIDYQRDAFNSDKSFLSWLKKAGYKTDAYLHPVYSFPLGLFDNARQHSANAGYHPESVDLMRFFAELWTYAVLPRSVMRFFQSSNEQQLNNQNLLNPAAPIISLHSMRKIIAAEPDAPENNHYIFAHLILPHFPYVLGENCEYDQLGKPTSPLAQSRCATRLMLELVAQLKALDRFTESLIIFHSDHGARFKIENNQLISVESKDGYFTTRWNLARSRPLLLIKPPGVSDDVPLITSPAEATLLDIAPSIGKTLGLDMPDNLDGISLVSPTVEVLTRKRHYYFFDKKGPMGWTDEMMEFMVEDGQMMKGEAVKLENNKPLH